MGDELFQRIANLHELDNKLECAYKLFYEHQSAGEAGTINDHIRSAIITTRLHVIKLLTGAVQQLHNFECEQADENFPILNSQTREIFQDSDDGQFSSDPFTD